MSEGATQIAEVLILLVVVGVGLVALSGWHWLDAAVAIGVALNILREGAALMWKSSQGLMDEALEPEVLAEVERALAGFRHPTIRFDHISSRRSGRRPQPASGAPMAVLLAWGTYRAPSGPNEDWLFRWSRAARLGSTS